MEHLVANVDARKSGSEIAAPPAAQWPRDAITSSVIARNDDGT
jgi:hypothetical protein